MEKVRIGVKESPEALSARTGRPICMLLRANRLPATAWLLPDREILVPAPDFCLRDAGACPHRLLTFRADRWEDYPLSPVLPERLRQISRLMHGLSITEWQNGSVYTVRAKQTVGSIVEECGCGESMLRRVNCFAGRFMPGMRLFVPFRE